MSEPMKTESFELDDCYVVVGESIRKRGDTRVRIEFEVGQDEMEAMPEQDPILGSLRMAEEVISRLKAEAFNKSLRKR